MIESFWLLIQFMHCSQLFKMHKQIELTRSLYWILFFCRIIIMETTIVNATLHSSEKSIFHSWRSIWKSIYFISSLSKRSQLIQWLCTVLVCLFDFCFFASYRRISFLFGRFVDFWNRFKFSLVWFGGTIKPNTKHKHDWKILLKRYKSDKKECTLQLDDALNWILNIILLALPMMWMLLQPLLLPLPLPLPLALPLLFLLSSSQHFAVNKIKPVRIFKIFISIFDFLSELNRSGNNKFHVPIHKRCLGAFLWFHLERSACANVHSLHRHPFSLKWIWFVIVTVVVWLFFVTKWNENQNTFI